MWLKVARFFPKGGFIFKQKRQRNVLTLGKLASYYEFNLNVGCWHHCNDFCIAFW